MELSFEDIEAIRKALKPNYILALKAIYETPHIQHNALGRKLNKSITNLSNIMKKIREIKPDLLQTSPSGTGKYYSLTPIARQYVEQELLGTGQSSESHSKFTETIITKTLKPFERFKKKCGSDWLSTLYALLNEENIDIDTEIQEIYKNLSDNLCQCRVQSSNALQQIFDRLENEQLVARITNYLDKKLAYFYLLEPLGKMNITTSFKMIDNVFSELHPLVFPPCQYENEKNQNPLLTPEKYNNLLLGIVKLSAEFMAKKYQKSTAVSVWESTYFLTEELAFYIAEKCSFLMLLGYQNSPRPNTRI